MSDPQDFNFEIYMKFMRSGESSFDPSPRVVVRFFERLRARESERRASSGAVFLAA